MAEYGGIFLMSKNNRYDVRLKKGYRTRKANPRESNVHTIQANRYSVQADMSQISYIASDIEKAKQGEKPGEFSNCEPCVFPAWL